MSIGRIIYLLLTEKKVHAYSSWNRWIKVRQRADVMGAKYESMFTDVKAGDPYKSKKVEAVRWGDATVCRVLYADSRGE